MQKLTRSQMAARVARDIPAGSYVNIGIGLPELVVNYLNADDEVVLHSENGVLGMGPQALPGQEDLDLISAGKRPVTLLTGGTYFDHVDSFAIMRGGHLDLCILGGMQVSFKGDLANWSLGRSDVPPAVGGAMDLAVGARKVFVLMEHNAKDGAPKLVQNCTLPLTGVAVVDRVYTDLAILDITPCGFFVREKLVEISDAALQACTGAKLHFSMGAT